MDTNTLFYSNRAILDDAVCSEICNTSVGNRAVFQAHLGRLTQSNFKFGFGLKIKFYPKIYHLSIFTPL